MERLLSSSSEAKREMEVCESYLRVLLLGASVAALQAEGFFRSILAICFQEKSSCRGRSVRGRKETFKLECSDSEALGFPRPILPHRLPSTGTAS